MLEHLQTTHKAVPPRTECCAPAASFRYSRSACSCVLHFAEANQCHFVYAELQLIMLPEILCHALQVAINNSDIDFKWSISPQLPPNQPTPAGTSAAVGAAAAADGSSHYGILLARMAGLPASITDAALLIAQRLDAQQRQRQLQQEGDGSMQRLRQVGVMSGAGGTC